MYSVQILFLTWPFLYNTSSSTRSMLSAVWVMRHLLLPEQWLTHLVTHSFCNNTGSSGEVQILERRENLLDRLLSICRRWEENIVGATLQIRLNIQLTLIPAGSSCPLSPVSGSTHWTLPYTLLIVSWRCMTLCGWEGNRRSAIKLTMRRDYVVYPPVYSRLRNGQRST